MFAFDLLMLDGRDLRQLPLVARKRELRRVLPRRCDRLLYLDHVAGRGIDLFRAVCERDLEGIVAKRRDSIYDPETATWVKVKNRDYSQARDRWELFERRAIVQRRGQRVQLAPELIRRPVAADTDDDASHERRSRAAELPAAFACVLRAATPPGDSERP